jgi:hypothetical protein
VSPEKLRKLLKDALLEDEGKKNRRTPSFFRKERKPMMKHYIIVKFTEGTDVKALVEPVRGIFEETLSIPGIHSLDIRISNSDIANRFDLMIIIDMEKEALPAYAASEPHLRWKSEYGDRIAKKAIFDCDI